MLRKLVLGAVAAAGLLFIGTDDAEAHRGRWRGGYYAPYYGGGYYYRSPRRAWRNSYRYSRPYYYGYGYPQYYYGYPQYYYSQPYYYGGVGVNTPNWGFYIQ